MVMVTLRISLSRSTAARAEPLFYALFPWWCLIADENANPIPCPRKPAPSPARLDPSLISHPRTSLARTVLDADILRRIPACQKAEMRASSRSHQLHQARARSGATDRAWSCDLLCCSKHASTRRA